MVRWVTGCLVLALAGCRADCGEAARHGMALIEQQLMTDLAGEDEDERKLARDSVDRARRDALDRCRERRMPREVHRCTLAARTAAELLACPGWE